MPGTTKAAVDWDPANTPSHIARHQVGPGDAEEIIASASLSLRCLNLQSVHLRLGQSLLNAVVPGRLAAHTSSSQS